MEIRKLQEQDTEQFCGLIKHMYNYLDNLEWFSPMPYDFDGVKDMIISDRLYIIGVFDGQKLVAVSCLDYMCGKLLDQVVFPENARENDIVEFGFNIVHKDYRGKGLMKQMIEHLFQKVKSDGFKYAFGKAHKDNLASIKSFEKLGFENYQEYEKLVKRKHYEKFIESGLLNSECLNKARSSCEKYKTAERIPGSYVIFLKKV